ncbi:MAG: hypothetical protein WCW16_00845 [Candidatus Magasanikbacteria bacterium]
MNIQKNKIISLTIFGIILCILNIFVVHSVVIGIIGIALYATQLSKWIGHLAFTKYERFGKKLFGFVILTGIIMTLNVLVYYPYKLTTLTTIIILLIPCFLFFIKSNQEKSTNDSPWVMERSHAMQTLLFVAIDIALIYILTQNSTTDVLPSPWMNIKPWFFILYAIATVILLHTVSVSRHVGKSIALISLHLFVTYSVASIIYTLGYGFDGFIHRATETWILNNGFITPKQPFYIGQYGLVVWLSQITHISIKILDIYLVPVLTSLTLPFFVYHALRYTWNIAQGIALNLTWLLPFLFFLSFYFTTPHNLALLFFILAVFATISYAKEKMPFIVPGVLCIMASITHPLIGAPLCVFVFIAFVIRKIKNKSISVVLSIFNGISIALVPIILFTLFLFIHHNPLPSIQNPFTFEQVQRFTELVARPHWYIAHAPIIFELLYLWHDAIIPLVVIIGLVGFFIKKEKTYIDYLLISSSLGSFIGAWLLRTWVVLPNLLEEEQASYPLRLLSMGLLFLMPFSMYGLYALGTWFMEKIKKSRSERDPAVAGQHIVKALYILGASALLMVSFYFSYPQRNPKVWFPGFNVSQADFSAVEWIRNQHTDYNYVVLSNPITAMAALTNYNFVKHFQTQEQGELFYYSIPSGGYLYRMYLNMLYEVPKEQFVDEVKKTTGVDTVYFVVNSYWGSFKKIVEEHKKTAKSWQSIDDGKVMIFTY